MSNYRVYPSRIIKPPRGICRWCGITILKEDGSVNRRKTFCTQVCVTYYLVRADPSKMREFVFFRDRGKCARCGFQHLFLQGEWEADHVLPLMIAFGDPSYWEPDNVVLLCTTPCHKDKSAEDRRKYRKKHRRRWANIYADETGD